MSLRAFTLFAIAASAGPAAAQQYPKLSPYPAIRWAPEVWIGGQWCVLRSVNGLPVEKIIAFAREQYGSNWDKRFGEDLVQVLTEMGHPPGKTARLVVVDPKTGKDRELADVPMTWEKREALRTAGPGRIPVGELRPAHLRQALDEFKATLDGRWSYRRAARGDIDAAIAAVAKKIDAGLSPNDFGIELQKVIALGIDGHSGVTGYTLPAGGFLPFLLEPAGDRFVAFKPDRAGFLADGFPFVTAIDGKPVGDWCGAAAVLVPKGSPQYVRRHSLRHLRDLDYLRGRTGLPRKDAVAVELADPAGTGRKTVTLPVAKSPPAYGEWPAGRSRVLAGNVGYLRLPDMNAQTSVPEIRGWMPKFRATAGLVVDVRDNGGGDRDALLLLYSYLAAPADPPRVVTAAAYRLHPAHKESHLAERFMYRAGAKEWAPDERAAVAEFAKTFRPEWELPRGQFSDWHYLVLRRRDAPDVYHYSKPVVVLMNEKCFSATDVFLAGLKGMKTVTLLGTPSGGGSALAVRMNLGETPFRVRLGTMASFQADGQLFDGNGVRPDVVVEPVPEYHIGGRDNALEDAVKRINQK